MPRPALDQLTRAACQGSVQAYCDLVLAAQEGVRDLVARCGVRGAAVDSIAQDAFITAWRNLQRFDLNGDFQAWVNGIARNLVRRHFTSESKRHRVVVAIDPDDCGSPEPVRSLPIDLLQSCLARLAGRARAIVQMRYFEERNATEIGSALGLEAAAVRMALQRALAALHECVSKRLGAEQRS